VFAEVEKIERQAVTDMGMDSFGDAYPARRCQRLETCGDIDAIAHEIVAIDDDVAEIDADAKAHAIGLGQARIVLVDLELNFGGAADRFDGARELGDDAVPRTSEDAPLMLRDQAVEDLAMRLERGQSPFLVPANEPAIADHISREDGSHSALNAIHNHASSRGTLLAILCPAPAHEKACPNCMNYSTTFGTMKKSSSEAGAFRTISAG
jgi:hypothetical protein